METGEPKKRGRKKSIPKAPDAYPYDSDVIHTKDYRLDPIGYCHDVLGIKSFTPMQERIFQLAMTPPYRVLVACGHGVGKSYGAACAVSWFFDSYSNGCALVTAPTHRDIVDVIFRNVRKQRLNAGLGGFVGNVVPELRGEAPDNYAKGFTAEKGESFSGRHQEHMLFIFDEATGIEPNFWETTSSMFHAKPGHHWIVYFNPLDTSCEAYRQWETGGWHKVQMGCLDHPNVVAGLAKQPEPYPGAVSVQQVDSWVKQWCDPVGEMEREETDIIWPPEEYSTPDRPSQWQRPSPRMEARALGRWPSSDLFGVWSRYAWQKCCMPVEWKPTLTILPEFGVDVAYTGEDYTVIHGRWGPKSFHHERHNGWSPRQTAARLKVLCAEAAALANTIRPHDAHMVEPEQIVAKVDADGMGVNVIDNAGGFCFRPVCGSGRAMRHEQYYNKRAESWFQVCQFAKDGICSVADLPQDTRDRLGKQLLCPKHKIDSRSGLILLEPKEETKKRLSVSPDDGDAFILAYAHAGNIASLAWEIQALSGVEQTRDRTTWEPPRTRQRGATAFNVPNYEDEDATRHAERRFWNFGV